MRVAFFLQVRWQVTTQTSDIFGAGTDAKVWVQVHGPNGMLNGAEIALDNSKNNFERNNCDTFFFDFPEDKDCGTPISKVRARVHSFPHPTLSHQSLVSCHCIRLLRCLHRSLAETAAAARGV